MSYPVELKLQVVGDSDVQSKLRSLNQQVQTTGQAAGKTTSPLKQMNQNVTQVGTSAQTTGKNIQQLGVQTDKSAKSAQTAQKAHVSLGSSVQNSALGFGLAASSAVSLWSAYDNVSDAAKRVELQHIAVERAENRLSKARLRLTKLQQGGKATAEQLRIAEKDVEIGEGNVEKAAFNLENAQEDLNTTWVESATSIIPAVFTGVSGLGMAFSALKGSGAAASEVMGTGRKGFGGALGLLTSPLGIIVGLVAGVAAGIWALRTNFMGVRDKAKEFIDWIKEATGSIPGLSGAIDYLVQGYKWFEDTLFGLLTKLPIVGGLFGDLGDKQTGASTGTDLLNKALTGLRDVLTNLPAMIGSAAHALWDGLSATATNLYKTLTSKEFQDKALAGIKWLFDTVSGFLEPIGESLWGGLVDTATWIYQTLQDPVFQKNVVDGVTAIFGGAANIFNTIGSTIWSGLVDTATWIYSVLQDPAFQKNVSDGVTAIFSGAGEVFKTIGSTIWSGLIATASWITTTLTDPAFQTAVINGIQGVFAVVAGALGPIGEALWAGLVNTASWIVTTLTDPVFQQNVLDGIKGMFAIVAGALAPVGEALWSGLVATATWITTTLSDPAFQTAVMNGIKGVFAIVGGGLASLGSTLWAGLTSAAQGLYDILVDPVFRDKAIAGITAVLTAVGGWIVSNATTIGEKLWTGMQQVADQFPGILGAAIGTTLGTLSGSILTGLADATTDLPEKLTAFFRDTQAFFDAIYNGFIGLFTHPEGVQKAVGEFPGKVQEAITKVDFAGAFTAAFGDAFGKTGGNAAYDKLVGNVGSLLTWINKGLSELPGKMLSTLSGLAKQFGDAFQRGLGIAVSFAYDTIVGTANSVWSWIYKGITELPGKLVTAFQGLDFKGIGNAFKDWVVGGINQAFTDIKTWIEQGAGGWLNSLGQAIVNGVTSLGGLLKKTSAPGGGVGAGGLQNVAFNPRGGITGDDPTFNARNAATTTAPPVPDFTAHVQAWTTFQNTVTAIIAQIGAQFQNLTLAYGIMLQGAQTALTQMATLWAGHLTLMTSTAASIGQQLQNLVLAYGILLTGVQTAITQMAVGWGGHAQVVDNAVNSTGQSLGRLVQGYGLLMAGVQRALDDGNARWGAHASAVSGYVNNAGQSIGRLIQGYGLLMQAVSRALSQGNQQWGQHASTVSNAASSGSSSVRNLASAVSSNMRSIISSVSSASSAIRNLQSSINALHGKTIYVTTVRRTVGGGGGGVVSAQHGFSGVVDQPTRFMTGEGNRPEFVQVTPLSNAGGRVSMNKAAETAIGSSAAKGINHLFSQPTVRAGGSSGKSNRADAVFITPNGQILTLDTKGNAKVINNDWKSRNEFKNYDDWVEAARKKAKKVKGLKGSETVQKLGKRDAPTKAFSAGLIARTTDPLTRAASLGGIRGRGGKSLFDLGLAKGGVGPNNIPGKKGIAYVVREKRYADGSVFRLYSNGSVEFGQDKYKKKKKKAATGFSGIVSSPTDFTVGEKGSEYVDVRPINQMRSSGSGGAAGANGGGGRPVVIEEHLHNHIDGKQVSESVRKYILKGVYAMS